METKEGELALIQGKFEHMLDTAATGLTRRQYEEWRERDLERLEKKNVNGGGRSMSKRKRRETKHGDMLTGMRARKEKAERGRGMKDRGEGMGGDKRIRERDAKNKGKKMEQRHRTELRERRGKGITGERNEKITTRKT